MSIYEIDSAIAALVDEETGELLDYDAFLELKMERDTKVENMIRWYKNELAYANAYKEEAASLMKLAEPRLNKAESLKKYISQVTEGVSFRCSIGETSWRKSSAVDIAIDADLDNKWLRTKTTVEPDKKAISEALKQGEVIPGASLVERNNMSIK